MPAGVPIASYTPYYTLVVTDNPAVHIDSVVRMDDLPGRLILLKGFWWFNWKDESQAYEDRLLTAYTLTPLVQRPITDELIYGLYLLTRKPHMPER